MGLQELKQEKIGICMSGGLSCLTVGKWLAEHGLETLSFIADIGQADQEEVHALASLLSSKGMPCAVLDLKANMAEMCFDLVKYQATYDGGYWNTTGASRAVLVMGLSGAMKERGCTMLAHGCVGGGNDQARFDRYTWLLAPELKVFTPWLDPELLQQFPSRAKMVEYLQSFGLRSGSGDKASQSTDANLAGVSHEGTALESLETPSTVVRPIMSVWPQEAPDKEEVFRVRFELGRAVEINGKRLSPLECMKAANEAAGRNGIALKDVLENRINGTKCRGVYEAPGLELLGRCLGQVYQATLEKQAAQLFESLSSFIGRQVYEGRYYDVSTRAARAAVDVMAEDANGTVEVGLYKGNIIFRGLSDYTQSPQTARQTRFSAGGHHWQIRSGTP